MDKKLSVLFAYPGHRQRSSKRGILEMMSYIHLFFHSFQKVLAAVCVLKFFKVLTIIELTLGILREAGNH